MNKNYVVISSLCIAVLIIVAIIVVKARENYYNPSYNSAFNVSPKHWNWNEIKENKNIDNK